MIRGMTGLLAAIAVGIGATACTKPSSNDFVVGVPEPPATTAADGARIVESMAQGSERRSAAALRSPDGRAPGGPLWFQFTTPVPGHLVFILVIGSDARPGDDPTRTNGDSIHLLAVNPRTLEGTIVGLPRDSWVEVPGHGQRKLTAALALGGPDLMAATVRNLTGLPIHYYVVTGFAGMANIVDELGGLDLYVDRRMNDRMSGARFEPGWHHLNGAEVLAFARNRHDVRNGDFTRSENQGKVILAALAKLRAEVSDEGGLGQWIRVILRHAHLDASLAELRRLGVLARQLDPARVANVVVPGRVGQAGRQSVVYLGADAARVFEDLRADAVIGAESAPPPDATSTTTTSTTSPTTSSTTSIPTTSTTATTLLPSPP